LNCPANQKFFPQKISWLLVRGVKLIVGLPTSVEKVLLSTKIERLEKSMRFIHVLSPR
jgi:hypothetical protein